MFLTHDNSPKVLHCWECYSSIMVSKWYCHDCNKLWLGDENENNDEAALHVWNTQHRVDNTFKNKQVRLTNYMDKIRKKSKLRWT